MKIIGHRGAAGLALENTLESIKEGIAASADYVEVDIRLTNDDKIVLSHDSDLKRTYGVDLKIRDHSLAQLRIPCPKLPELQDALKLLKHTGIIIEFKEFIEPEKVLQITNKFPGVDIRFASFNHHSIRALKKYSPKSYCYVLEHHSPFEIMNHATSMKADGVGLNYGVLNPLSYLIAKRKKLDVYVYTLNKLWLARLIAFIYRDVYICTDFPNLLKVMRTK